MMVKSKWQWLSMCDSCVDVSFDRRYVFQCGLLVEANKSLLQLGTLHVTACYRRGYLET
jgi:hypothetical protein